MSSEPHTEIEQVLAHELDQIAEATRVPPMPSLTPRAERPTLPARLWQPLVVAATVVVLVGVIALLVNPPGRTVEPSAPADVTTPAPAEPTTEGPTSEVTSTPVGPYDAESTLAAVVEAVVADDRASLLDQDVVADSEWDLLVDFADGKGGSASTCRDNGGGTRDCEIDLLADPTAVYYAILEPASNAYGWRVTYVSIASD